MRGLWGLVCKVAVLCAQLLHPLNKTFNRVSFTQPIHNTTDHSDCTATLEIQNPHPVELALLVLYHFPRVTANPKQHHAIKLHPAPNLLSLREVKSHAPSDKLQHFPLFVYVVQNIFRGCVEAYLKRDMVFSKPRNFSDEQSLK